MALAITFMKFVPVALSYLGSGGSLVISSITQLATFAVLARTLGTEQFALYITISAFINVAVQLCGLGSQESLVRRVAQDPADYPRLMGHSLLLVFGTGGILLVLGLAVLPIIVPLSPDAFANYGSIGLLLVSTIVLMRLVSLATATYMAKQQFMYANALEVSFGLIRMVATIIGCLAFGVSTVAAWSVWFFFAHLLAAGVGVWLILRLGTPRFTIVREEIRIGILFSTQFVFRAIRQNTDIVVLGLFTSAEIVASYGVARRVLDTSYLSIEALNRIIYPGSAVALRSGFHVAASRVLKVMAAGVGIAVFGSLAVYLCAPLMPLLFGGEYISMVGFTQILCWVLIPVAVSSVALDVFGAAGRQDVRALIYNSENILAALLGAFAAYVAGVYGAFVSLYIIEFAVAIVATLVLRRFIAADRGRFAQVVPAE